MRFPEIMKRGKDLSVYLVRNKSICHFKLRGKKAPEWKGEIGRKGNFLSLTRLLW